MRIIVPLFVVALVGSTLAQDIRDKVAPPATRDKVIETIDPDSHIFGIPYGTSEDEFISRFGSPTGYLRMSVGESGMLYGKTHCFLFTNGKLSGVRISFFIVDHKLTESITASTIFDPVAWRLDNGITRNTNLAEVKRILGERLVTDRYEHYYDTQRARVDLGFSQMVSEGDKEESYKVFSLLVRLK